jgi:uncharacterized membrane protein YhaH (DUF805 family)
MSALFAHPKRVYLALAITIVAGFALSAVGNSGTEAENAASDVGWIGAVGWFAFLVAILLTLLFTVALLLRRLRHRQPV